jgi:hypothetical protein
MTVDVTHVSLNRTTLVLDCVVLYSMLCVSRRLYCTVLYYTVKWGVHDYHQICVIVSFACELMGVLLDYLPYCFVFQLYKIRLLVHFSTKKIRSCFGSVDNNIDLDYWTMSPLTAILDLSHLKKQTEGCIYSFFCVNKKNFIAFQMGW